MERYKIHICAIILVVVMLLWGCPSKQPVDLAPTEPPLLEPVVPVDYQKIPPTSIDSSEQMLAQTASIFLGVLKDVQFTYDDCAGPRINYVFSDSKTLAGTQVQSQVTLKILGGPTLNGTWVRVSVLPQLALDSHYVVFLRNTDWTFSPIVGNLVFRREMIGSREVLIDPTGHAVIGWGDEGPLLSTGSVSEAVGQRLRGYRSSEAPTQTAHSNSDKTAPNPQVSPATDNAPDGITAQIKDSSITRAPSLAEAQKSGLFIRPALSVTAIGNESTVSVESLVAFVSAAADRGRVNIGGRITLNPYWRCWGFTPTAKAGR